MATAVVTINDDIVHTLRVQLGNPTESDIAGEVLVDVINRAIREFSKYRGRRKVDMSQITIADQADYDVPPDYASVEEVLWSQKDMSAISEVANELFHNPSLQIIHDYKVANELREYEGEWELVYEGLTEKLRLEPPPSVADKTIVIIYLAIIAKNTLSHGEEDILLIYAEALARLSAIGTDAIVKIGDVTEDKRTAFEIVKELKKDFRSKAMQGVAVERT